MIYKAENIDTNKFLEELERMDKDAHHTHIIKKQIEEARFEQEHKTLNQVMDMFYCSNYEKEENDNNDDDKVIITKQQYDEYQKVLDNFEYAVDSKIETELNNWQKETLGKLISCLKSEEYLLYGDDGKQNICNISYEELDKVLAFAFSCEVKDIPKNM